MVTAAPNRIVRIGWRHGVPALGCAVVRAGRSEELDMPGAGHPGTVIESAVGALSRCLVMRGVAGRGTGCARRPQPSGDAATVTPGGFR